MEAIYKVQPNAIFVLEVSLHMTVLGWVGAGVGVVGGLGGGSCSNW